MGEKQQHLYEFGPFRLDTTERILSRDGAPLTLSPKAFETLVVLIERRGRLIEKAELMDALWPESMVEEANLTNNVWALRKTLCDGQNDHRYVETVPKRGYRFTADVTELSDTHSEVVVKKHSFTRIITEETEVQEAEATVDTETRPRNATDSSISPVQHLRIRALLTLAAACMMFIGTATVLQRLGVSGGRLIPDAAAASSSPSMIAVLPFVNESDDSDSDYLSDGLSESLVNSLSQLPQLKVIARSSAFKYKGREGYIASFKAREMTGARVYEYACDGVLLDDMLNAEGNAFAHHYFDLESGEYIYDYEELLARGLPSTYHVEDTWDNYEVIARRISDRYAEWKRRDA